MSNYETLPDGNIKVPLSDGNWAEVRTTADLRRADERAILDRADADGVDLTGSTRGLSSVAALQDAVAARMVRRWSLKGDDGEPLPVAPESIQELRSVDSAALISATAPVLTEVIKNLAGSADPKSDTDSSSPDAKGS